MEKTIENYVLGHIKAENITISTRLGDFSEEDIVIY